MPSERYFIDSPLIAHSQLELKETEFHHLAHVMRTRAGETIELVNGKGVLAEAIVDNLRKDRAFLTITHVLKETQSSPQLILAQAMPKPNRLDFILEKGTELGVDAFWLFPGQLSVKKEWFPNQLERAQAMLIAAMKQCGRLTLPSLLIKPGLDQWNRIESTTFFGDLEEEAPLLEETLKKIEKPVYPLVFVTGPESGFTEEEIHCLRELGAIGTKLHGNILRTDTASIMAVSLLSHYQYKDSR